MKHVALFFVVIAVLIFSCRKEDEDFGLPPATQTGENTFGCLINGNPWVAKLGPDVYDATLRKITSSYDEEGFGVADYFDFYLTANYISLADSIYDSFSFSLRPIYGSGLISSPNIKGEDIHYTDSQPDIATSTYTYLLDTLYPAHVNITKLDKGSNICAGSFDFRLINTNKKDTLLISNGRFDVKYQPQ
ncbi:MAG: hypothetical protein WCR52_04655 [Bacteroidota bacterium]